MHFIIGNHFNQHVNNNYHSAVSIILNLEMQDCHVHFNASCAPVAIAFNSRHNAYELKTRLEHSMCTRFSHFLIAVSCAHII